MQIELGKSMQSKSAMIAALQSTQPRAEIAAKLQLFGQFVGSWDVEVIFHKPDGTRQSVQGEWHFGWVLDGRAIQDVWITPKRSLRAGAEEAGGEYGATLRFYDPKIDAWRSTWIGPARGFVLPFIARQIDDEIVLEGDFEPDASRKWIFSDITADSFHWRAIESTDHWITYRMVQEMFATRRRSELS
jgi:hypothetical protein